MPDLKGLATHMAPDKGYSGEPPGHSGLRGFVCPRANAYGGREGIIPPAVAAVRGLVPKGMRHIASTDVARSANAARDSKAVEAEQYMEYYGRGAKAAAAREAAVAPVPPSPPPRAPAAPAPTPTPTSQGTGKRRARRAAQPARPAPAARPSPPTAEPVLRDPDDPGMFSKDSGAPDAADTLDSFYDSLRGPTPGTGETDLPGRKGAVKVGVDFGDGPGETVEATVGPVGAPPPAEPRAYGIKPRYPAQPGLAEVVSQLAEEKAELKRVAESLHSQVEALQAQLWDAQRQLDGAAARDQHYARIKQELANRPVEFPAETVRVALSAPEERLKVGGRGWECNLVGALHLGRSGASAVLAVSDPSYGSELIASLQAAESGAVVVLSAAARTYCTYAGHCVKIYGDADSPDFITLVWLNVDRGAHSE